MIFLNPAQTCAVFEGDRMWADKRILDLFGIGHPIIQAPMAGSSTPELAASVGSAGALGSLGCGMSDADGVRNSVTELRKRTNASFNLNFFVLDKLPKIPDGDFETLQAHLRPYYQRLGIEEFPEKPVEPGLGFDDEMLQIVIDAGPRWQAFISVRRRPMPWPQ
ncbi:MAG: nitronate monooxygenase [Boseongicola sp.]